MTDVADFSRADLRRALRALPPERRRALARAVREGRAVHDPRDAALAVAWARRLQAVPWLGWVLPRTRPHGRRAILWLLHAAWVVAAVVAADVVLIWRSGGILGWVVVGALAYSIVSLPWALARILRMRWNAPEAERRNRELRFDTTTVTRCQSVSDAPRLRCLVGECSDNDRNRGRVRKAIKGHSRTRAHAGAFCLSRAWSSWFSRQLSTSAR